MSSRLAAVAVVLCFALGCSTSRPAEIPSFSFRASQLETQVGGHPVVVLSQEKPKLGDGPQFLSAQILPGKGGRVLQVQAFVPGQGETNLLASVGLGELATAKSGLGAEVVLTSHDYLLDSPADKIAIDADADRSRVTEVFTVKDFGRKSDALLLAVTQYLQQKIFGFTIIAKNLGSEKISLGLGWAPSFFLPNGPEGHSGDIRLRISAGKMISQTVSRAHSKPSAFAEAGGHKIGKERVSELFADLRALSDGTRVAELIDPVRKFGLRIKLVSPAIQAVKVMSTEETSGIRALTIRPQFEWTEGGMSSSFASLSPGDSVTYSVEIEIFEVSKTWQN